MLCHSNLLQSFSISSTLCWDFAIKITSLAAFSPFWTPWDKFKRHKLHRKARKFIDCIHMTRSFLQTSSGSSSKQNVVTNKQSATYIREQIMFCEKGVGEKVYFVCDKYHQGLLLSLSLSFYYFMPLMAILWVF